jgi:hypothetical protein
MSKEDDNSAFRFGYSPCSDISGWTSEVEPLSFAGSPWRLLSLRRLRCIVSFPTPAMRPQCGQPPVPSSHRPQRETGQRLHRATARRFSDDSAPASGAPLSHRIHEANDAAQPQPDWPDRLAGERR